MAIDQLPPAVEMAARARESMLNAEIHEEDEWLRTAAGKWIPNKKKGQWVNVNAARSSARKVIEWVERVRATAVYTLDGSRDLVTIGAGDRARKEMRSARAAGDA